VQVLRDQRHHPVMSDELQKLLPVGHLRTFRTDQLVILEPSLWPAGTNQEQVEFGTPAGLPVSLRVRGVTSILQVWPGLSATDSKDISETMNLRRRYRDSLHTASSRPLPRCIVQKARTDVRLSQSKD
jgi:hypothetical protein